jgi:hypothetical protein
MEQLPIEICRGIIEHLGFESIKSIRQTSKFWGLLGEEYLISPTFTSFPHRPDIIRLSSISKHPKFRFRVQSLKLNHGEINEYHARHNIYFLQFMREPEERVTTQVSTWGVYAQLKANKENHLQASCKEDTLTGIFHELPNLQEINVSLMTCPFETNSGVPDLLHEIWRIPSTRLLPRVETTERFTSIMLGLSNNLTTLALKTLSHDRLPFEFFAQKPRLIETFSQVFCTLTTLNLAIDYSDMPNNLHYAKGFQNLSHFLRSTSSLQTLSLEFYGRKKLDIAALLSSFREHNYAFPALTNLTLKTIATTEEDLGHFLARQTALQRLKLGGKGLRAPHQPANGGVRLNQGSFGGLFERLRKEIKGVEVLVQGDLVGLESGERWVLDDVEAVENLKEYVID